MISRQGLKRKLEDEEEAVVAFVRDHIVKGTPEDWLPSDDVVRAFETLMSEAFHELKENKGYKAYKVAVAKALAQQMRSQYNTRAAQVRRKVRGVHVRVRGYEGFTLSEEARDQLL